MTPAWQLSDLRDDLRPQSPRTIVRAVAADSYTISSNGTSPGNGKTLSGRFAVFDTWAEVNSLSEGHFVEKIQRGAFAKTIRERGGRVPVMFSHGKDPVVGLQVLGQVRDLHEDAQGVAYEVELFDGLPPLLLEGLKAGSYGASFRARLVKNQYDPYPGRSAHNPAGLPESVVTELALREFGPVAEPVYTTTTAEVRSLVKGDAPRPRAGGQRGAEADPRPAWYLGDLRDDLEPAWQLIRKEHHHGREFVKA